MPAPELYAFAEFTLDATERRLSKDGRPIPLEPKTHDVVVVLVRHAGRLVTKRELLDLVWPESFVGEGILTVHISSLRKALGEEAGQRAYIEGGHSEGRVRDHARGAQCRSGQARRGLSVFGARVGQPRSSACPSRRRAAMGQLARRSAI